MGSVVVGLWRIIHLNNLLKLTRFIDCMRNLLALIELVSQKSGCLRLPNRALKNSPTAGRYLSIDVAVYVIIFTLGALQVGFSLRSGDFFTGDVTYFELARSIIARHFYGFDFRPETLLPPGFPAILAGLCVVLGCSYTVVIRSIAVSTTLGFIASYELFTFMGEQFGSTMFCLILATSPIIFGFTTRLVLSDEPYFFTSMLALLLAVRLDAAKGLPKRIFLWLLCSLFLVVSLLIRSSGIALFAAMFAWLVVSWRSNREVFQRRLKTFVPLLLIGLFTQLLWMEWGAKHEVLQWPMIGGYPQSYFRQLEMKNGNIPDAGKASWSDIPARIEKNLNDQAVLLAKLLTRKDYVNPVWTSPIVIVPVLFILFGLCSAIWRNGGGLLEWYFVFHEVMYLLWPWNFEIRFFLPVAPLVCFYLWRGTKAVVGLLPQFKARAVGTLTLFISLAVSLDAVPYSWHSGKTQRAVAALFWVLLAAISAWVAYAGSYKCPDAVARFLARWKNPISIGKVTLTQVSGIMFVAALLVLGAIQEISIGRKNLNFDITKDPGYPDILGANWIRTHSAGTAVIMARQLDVVYHYDGGRQVIWFPPVRNPKLLMEGIRKYNVEFIIVNEREYSYWLPPEQDCFQSLARAYPGNFQLVHQEPRLKIFEVVPDFT